MVSARIEADPCATSSVKDQVIEEVFNRGRAPYNNYLFQQVRIVLQALTGFTLLRHRMAAEVTIPVGNAIT